MFKNKLKTHLFALTLTLSTTVLSVQSMAQNLNCVQPLLFGEIARCGSTGTVTIHPDGTYTSSCVDVVFPPTEALCVVTQFLGLQNIVISVDTTSVSISNGSDNMTVDDFNIVSNGNGPTFVTNSTNTEVPIGATVTLSSSQGAGNYSGTFTISANYE